MKKVTIYSGDNCKYCNLAKEFFKENNIDYIEHNVSSDMDAKKFLFSKKVMSVPFIMIDDKEFIGFDKEKIINELK